MMNFDYLLRLAKDLYRVGARRIVNVSRRVKLSTQVDRLEVLVKQLEAQQIAMHESARLLSKARWIAMSQQTEEEGTFGTSANSSKPQGDPALQNVVTAVTGVWRQALSSSSGAS